jgi:hypothetical protein
MTLRKNVLYCFETSETTHTKTYHHVLDDFAFRRFNLYDKWIPVQGELADV